MTPTVLTQEKFKENIAKLPSQSSSLRGKKIKLLIKYYKIFKISLQLMCQDKLKMYYNWKDLCQHYNNDNS